MLESDWGFADFLESLFQSRRVQVAPLNEFTSEERQQAARVLVEFKQAFRTTREAAAHFVVEGYGEQSGLLVHTQQVNCQWKDLTQRHWPTPFYVAPAGGKYIVEDDSILMPHYDGGWPSDGGQIQSLTGMTFEKVTRLVLTTDAGGEVLWDNGHQIRSARLSDDYRQPVATFTRRGHLVVADDSTCDVFNADGHTLRFRAQGPVTAGALAVLPAPHLDQFALVTSDGRVRLFEIPRP